MIGYSVPPEAYDGHHVIPPDGQEAQTFIRSANIRTAIWPTSEKDRHPAVLNVGAV